jgi:hypothetical protein
MMAGENNPNTSENPTMKTCLFALSMLFAAAVSLPNVCAQGTKAKSEPKRDTYPLYGKVVAITTRTLTIVRSESAEAKESKYTVNSATEVVNGDKPATLKDVLVGRWVGGTLKKADGDGNDVAVKINIGVDQKKAAPKSAKNTPKKK